MLWRGPDAVGVDDVSDKLEFGGEELGLGQVDSQACLAQALNTSFKCLQCSSSVPELIKISSRYTNTKSKSPKI